MCYLTSVADMDSVMNLCVLQHARDRELIAETLNYISQINVAETALFKTHF